MPGGINGQRIWKDHVWKTRHACFGWVSLLLITLFISLVEVYAHMIVCFAGNRITGEIEFDSLEGPECILSLSGKFWHRRGK